MTENPQTEQPAVDETASRSLITPETRELFETFLNHQRNAIIEASKALKALIPTATLEHSEQAVRESVEGYRVLYNSVIDDVIETVDQVRWRLTEDLDESKEQLGQMKIEESVTEAKDLPQPPAPTPQSAVQTASTPEPVAENAPNQEPSANGISDQ
ncbi:MAG: hypothetical protein GYB67_12685 [Chloroflexi bacterium]|nr:hypothetical protein [Chloroflexota bacterium]